MLWTWWNNSDEHATQTNMLQLACSATFSARTLTFLHYCWLGMIKVLRHMLACSADPDTSSCMLVGPNKHVMMWWAHFLSHADILLKNKYLGTLNSFLPLFDPVSANVMTQCSWTDLVLLKLQSWLTPNFDFQLFSDFWGENIKVITLGLIKNVQH